LHTRVLTQVCYDFLLDFVAVEVAVGKYGLAGCYQIGFAPPATFVNDFCQFVSTAEHMAKLM
ncbi:hypothetical protein RA274_29075, partial [Pseudomonas syringae pv. tagetis]|uniref:hypothetical protein n=1 Tax=Pseudomonas syringae group genomosp. 7 TaxID=251699 RepID=UPI00376F9F2F